ncbi:MAG: ribonuclease H [Prevotellaceae bacterium]|nr:ribonuclease H [Prevotellaceae bacterium]
MAYPLEGIREAWTVDASCTGNPGPMEYRCVHLPSGKLVFHYGPLQGTNNIGEFLAIVHALALQKQRGISGVPVFTDSKTALAWVRDKRARTTLQLTPQTEKALQLTRRAEAWLRGNAYSTELRKWDTEQWGEIPADFGRKKS